MIVEGVQIPPVIEEVMERWMLEDESFSALRATVKAETLLKEHRLKPDLGMRLTDRLIQRLRKAGKLTFSRVKGSGVVWKAVP